MLRQLLIGVDAMEWDLVTRWATQGTLPTFKRLIEHGTRGELQTPSAQLPDTVWSSLCTGVNPAKLETFFYVQYEASTMGLRRVHEDAIRRPPFWRYLSAAGRRVGVVDAPKWGVDRSLNGFQLANWGVHAAQGEPASVPDSLLGEVRSRFGDHPVGACDAVSETPRSLRRLRQRVLDGVRQHGRVFRALMQERPWDIFFGTFSAPHCIGHHFWRFLDSTHPRHPRVDAHGFADSVEQVYKAVDHELGEILALAGPDIICMVLAAHGMGPLYHASWNLPEILNRLGYGRPGSAVTAAAVRDARVNPWRIVKMALPGWLQYRIKAALPVAMQDYLLFRWYSGAQQWEGCRAFAIPNNDSVGAIRISVKGRDRHGLVEPGTEYWRICRDVAAALAELVDPVSGRSVVRRITLTHEEFDGPYLERLPDITVLWENSFPWQSIHSSRIGTLRLRRQDARTGSHRAHGFVLTTGPAIAAGRVLSGYSTYDIAPTVLRTADVPFPADLDGRPLPLRHAAVAS